MPRSSIGAFVLRNIQTHLCHVLVTTILPFPRGRNTNTVASKPARQVNGGELGGKKVVTSNKG